MDGTSTVNQPHFVSVGSRPLPDLNGDWKGHTIVYLTLEEALAQGVSPGSVAAVVVSDTTSPEETRQDISRLTDARGLVLSSMPELQPDIQIPENWPAESIRKSLKLALKYWQAKKFIRGVEGELNTSRQEKHMLSSIGIALSAEKDLDRLLDLILTEARALANCEAVSLFLVNGLDTDKPALTFKLTQNEVIRFEFQEKSFPLNKESLAGYVALTGKTLNLANVYEIPADAPYGFDSSFDQKTGYKTREMLVIPMRNHQNSVIGVLQFLNRKSSGDNNQENASSGFGGELAETLVAMANQAAVAIDNSLLLENIHHLFEGFVSASVKAIEARDPVTSGHSFRVAGLTVNLARILPNSELPQFRNVDFTREELRELKYAALLHDFGKVGVRERVLVKPKKLDNPRLEMLRFRILWQKERLEKEFYQKLVEHHATNSRTLVEQQKQLLHNLEQELARLDHFYQVIEQANEPSILPEDTHQHLHEIRDHRINGAPWSDEGLISDEDFLALSVTKGSLTEEERKEIESHVVHTFEYLTQIPWTKELKNIPNIAVAHHEKMDGSGYPNGLAADEIPLQSRIMAIADIYDALTARDRPYKRALSENIALDILSKEAGQGLLDDGLVNLFIEAKIYQQPLE